MFLFRSSKPKRRLYFCERSRSAGASIKILKSYKPTLARLSILQKPHPFRRPISDGIFKQEGTVATTCLQMEQCSTSIGLKDVESSAMSCSDTLGKDKREKKEKRRRMRIDSALCGVSGSIRKQDKEKSRNHWSSFFQIFPAGVSAIHSILLDSQKICESCRRSLKSENPLCWILPNCALFQVF